MARLRAASYDEQLSVVDHLDELRSRLILTGLVVLGAFVVCFWQNSLMLELANRPLPAAHEPTTLAVTEPLMTTFTVSFYGALLIALPVILWQAYAYVLPAFSPHERRTAMPLLLSAPILFVGGVAFAYFVLVPIGVDFLLGFNQEEFDVQVRAREYYGFLGLALVAFGALFQLPLGILVCVRLGIVDAEWLRYNRRFAVLVLAIAAALTTSPDPLSMLVALGPLMLLYELSIVLATTFGRAEAIDEPLEEGSEHQTPPPGATDG